MVQAATRAHFVAFVFVGDLLKHSESCVDYQARRNFAGRYIQRSYDVSQIDGVQRVGHADDEVTFRAPFE